MWWDVYNVGKKAQENKWSRVIEGKKMIRAIVLHAGVCAIWNLMKWMWKWGNYSQSQFINTTEIAHMLKENWETQKAK